MNSRTLDARRALTVAALIFLLTTISLTPAGARSQLETYHAQKRHIARTLTSVHRARHARAVTIRRVMHRSTAILRHGPGRGQFADPSRWQHIKHQLKRERWEARKRLNALDRTTQRTVQTLTTQRASINAWLGTWAVLQSLSARRPARRGRQLRHHRSPAGRAGASAHGQRHHGLDGHPDRGAVPRLRVGLHGSARRARGPRAGRLGLRVQRAPARRTANSGTSRPAT